MTKQEFIQRVAQKSGLTTRDAGKAVDAFMEAVTETLRSRDSINFTGFGDRKSTRLNSSHIQKSRMPSSA